MSQFDFENVNHIDAIDTNTHKHLDLIRRLENTGFDFEMSPAVATDQAQTHSGTPTDKLIHRALLLDESEDCQTALNKADFLVKGVGRIYAGASFVVGFVGVFGLLSTHIVNFFYVLIGLLGWHTCTLIWWLVGLKNPNRYSSIYGILDKLSPKDPIASHAFEIELEEFQQNGIWQLGKIVHRAWLFGLGGSVLALLVMFLFKSYTFVWESTLLTSQHFTYILQALSLIPSLVGYELPSQIDIINGTANARLATLIILSVVLYGIVPRLVVYLLCHHKAKWQFTIDNSLYYYENLIRTFSRQIVDKDDFTPTPALTANPATLTKNVVVATLEWEHASPTWHGQSNATNLDVLDTKEHIAQLIYTARTQEASIIIGIDSNLLPDRGVLRKLDTICQHAPHGVVVKLLSDDGGHVRDWQTALAQRQLGWL